MRLKIVAKKIEKNLRRYYIKDYGITNKLYLNREHTINGVITVVIQGNITQRSYCLCSCTVKCTEINGERGFGQDFKRVKESNQALSDPRAKYI